MLAPWAIVWEKIKQVEAMVGVCVDVGAIEATEGINGGVVGEEDGIGGIGIGGEARVHEHATVEDEIRHQRVSTEPVSGARVGLLAKAVVGKVGADFVHW